MFFVVSVVNVGSTTYCCRWRYYLGHDCKASNLRAISWRTSNKICLSLTTFISLIFTCTYASVKLADTIVVLLFVVVLAMVSSNESSIEIFRVPIGAIASETFRFDGNLFWHCLGVVANNLFVIFHGVIMEKMWINVSVAFFCLFYETKTTPSQIESRPWKSRYLSSKRMFRP